jgi:outer membrane protein TolC
VRIRVLTRSRRGRLVAVASLAAAIVAPLCAGAQAKPTPTPEQVAAELGYDLTQPLTLEQCLGIALRVHPDMRVAIADLDRATASLRQARASLWPSIQASTDYRVTQQPQSTAVIGGAVIPVGGGETTSRNTTVGGSYAFYDPSRPNTIRQAQVYRDAADAGVDNAERQLAYLVTQAYYDRLAAERLVAVKEAAVASAQAHVEDVQARIDAGDAAPIEIHSVRAQLYQAQLELSSARSQAATARASLRLALGDPRTPITLVDAWQEPQSLPELAESLETALASRPDLAQQRALVRGAGLGVKLARIEQHPRLSIVGSGEYGRHDGQDGPSWSIYGGLQQTVFDGGAAKAVVQQAEAQLRSAEAQCDRLEQTVRLEVESAWWRVRESAEAIAAAEAAQTEARAALAAAETRYAANVGIVLEITDAQIRASEADVSVVRAYYDYNTALADLQRATAGSREP